ncbi:MAG: hypothetical protein JW704_07000, partial [Anaerolineaceae bacterium]|nr:hypothetical protein [Anaerolineaceae bacterium]
MPIGKYTHFIIAWSLLACLLSKGLSDVSAKDSPLPTGSLVVSVLSEVGLPPEGLRIDYIQTSHDFLIGYDGPIPEVGLPDPPVGFNLILKCIPWSEIEPSRGSFPYEDEEISYYPVIPPGMITGNDCLLDFGNGGLTGWPDDLQELAFEVLLERVPIYLEHAVRYQTSRGISLFVIKEPTYPNADLMSLTASQWVRLVKLACETIRMEAPWARIVIEIIPQYLPMLGYTPYTFLDNLIRGGVGFDGIMMVFSRPIA